MPQNGRSSRGAPTEHSYHLRKGSKAPWATLRGLSSASSPKQLPIWIGSEPITGSVLLDFDQQDSIQSVVITVKGQIVTGVSARETTKFLEHATTIWAMQAGTTKPSGKLDQPFSISMPSVINLDGYTYRVPQSFTENESRATVTYTLSATFSRKRFRLDDEIMTSITYIPVIRPNKPSPLQLLAYERNMPLPGPSDDGDGWEALAPVVFSGIVFGSRPVQATCSLFLAKPLCYTRGTFLPCAIRIQCDDDQGLDIFSSPKAIQLSLQRDIVYGSTSNANKFVHGLKDIAVGVWWPCHSERAGVRELQGEIELSKSLQPTTEMLHLSIKYLVTVRPFEAPGFKPTPKADTLLSAKLDIATRLAKGLRVKPYSTLPVLGQASVSDVPRTRGLKNLYERDDFVIAWM